MSDIKKWYAAYIRQGHGKKVIESLHRRQIETYCPVNRMVDPFSDSKKHIHAPLFESYIFLKANDEEIPAIKEIDGVINFLFWLGRPAVIADSEIDVIKDFLYKYTVVRLERIPMNMDQVQMICDQAIRPLSVVILDETQTISASLPSLGYLMVGKTWAENAEASDEPLLQKWSRTWTQFEKKLMQVMQID